jgi:Cholesterol oxidase, substrate-binding
VDGAGRVEAISFPFTDTPWRKVGTIAPTQPAFSAAVTGPYNYSFTNSVTTTEDGFFDEIVEGDTSGTPAYEGTAMALGTRAWCSPGPGTCGGNVRTCCAT